MSEISEVGKGFAGWAEENSGLAVDENFEYTDRTVGNFAAAAFAAGAKWQAECEPTDAEIEAASITAVNKLHGLYPDSMPCWEDSSEDTQSRAKQYAVYMLEAARKAVSVDE